MNWSWISAALYASATPTRDGEGKRVKFDFGFYLGRWRCMVVSVRVSPKSSGERVIECVAVMECSSDLEW